MRRGTRAWVIGLLVASWAQPAWAGGQDPTRPPVQRPSSVDVASPEPDLEREAEPASEPEAEPEPPHIEPEPEPEPIADPPMPSTSVSEVTLPGYDDQLVTATSPDISTPPTREVPRDGRGMQALGSIAVVGGAGLFVGTTLLAIDGVESGIWGPTLALGVGATLTGSLLLYGGRRRQLAYREWAAAQPDVAPPQGNGLVATGGALLIVGAAGGMFGTIGWMASSFGYNPDGPRVPTIPAAMLGVGIGSLAAGSALMIVGMKRHKRFQAWRTRGVELVPSASPLAGGAQIGVSGRF